MMDSVFVILPAYPKATLPTSWHARLHERAKPFRRLTRCLQAGNQDRSRSPRPLRSTSRRIVRNVSKSCPLCFPSRRPNAVALLVHVHEGSFLLPSRTAPVNSTVSLLHRMLAGVASMTVGASIVPRSGQLTMHAGHFFSSPA